MFFFTSFFQKSLQPLFGEPKPPFETPDEHTGQYKHRAYGEEATHTAFQYLSENFESLADRHAAAISQSVSNTHSFSLGQLQKNVRNNEKKLKLAHKLLLQQCDARWGKQATNDALDKLGRKWFIFRSDVKM